MRLFLFSGNFCSVDACVVCIVSARSNQSSFAFLILTSSACIDASTLSSMLESPLPIWPRRLRLSNKTTASLQMGNTSTPNVCPIYDTKQSDGKVPVILKLWGIQKTRHCNHSLVLGSIS